MRQALAVRCRENPIQGSSLPLDCHPLRAQAPDSVAAANPTVMSNRSADNLQASLAVRGKNMRGCSMKRLEAVREQNAAASVSCRMECEAGRLGQITLARHASTVPALQGLSELCGDDSFRCCFTRYLASAIISDGF